MIYLYWYLGIGVAVVLAVFIVGRLTVKDEPNIMDMLEKVNPDRNNWDYKLLNHYIGPIVVALTMPFFWPILLYFKAKEVIDRSRIGAEPAEQVFAVTRADLRHRVTVDEVEMQEKVVDPMGAVPDCPFGFLNAEWVKFKSLLLPSDEIWSFSARWEQRRFVETRHGYAILRAKAVPHFLIAGWDTFELPQEPPELEPTFKELECKLTSWHWETRWSAIYGRKWKLTPKQIDRAQRDWRRMVRFAIAKRFDLDLTPKQIEKGLTDKDDSVREIYAYRSDYSLSPEQIERWLTDKSGSIKLSIASRREVRGVLTAVQIERGLTDDNYCVRWHFAEIADFSPSANQIERGLTDESEEVRLAFAKREDVRLTHLQLQRGVLDRSDAVRAVFDSLQSTLPLQEAG